MAALIGLLAEYIANGPVNLDDLGDDPRLLLGDTVLDDAVLDTLVSGATDWLFA
jgi:hypothetical protein